MIDNIKSDQHVKSFIKYDYKHKKVQSYLTNTVVYDIETFDTDKAIPYILRIYKLTQMSAKYNRDTTQQEYEKCRKD